MPGILGVVFHTALISGPASEAATAPQQPNRRKEWALHFAPGFDYFTFRLGSERLSAMGGGFRFGAHKSLKKGGFFIAGGPVLQYTYLTEVGKMGPADKLHLATFNGDMLIGGGSDRIVGYGHLTLGLGVITGEDGETGARITGPGFRSAVGAGLHGYVTDRISVGAMCDVGWAGVGIWVNPMLTLNVHFPVN